MELHITSRSIELSPEVRRRLERKLGRLGRLTKDATEIRLELAEEKTKPRQDRYLVRLTIDSGNTLLHSEERGENVLTAFDRVAAKMERQVEHHKGKLRNKGKGSSLTKSEPVLNMPAAAKTGKVVRVKRFTMKPMTVAEAADQMELLGHGFFLFYNIDAGQLNLLYRRKGGDYGLIEPVPG